jgi:hypothetical protein
MIGNAMNRKYDGPKFINGLTSEQYIKNAERKLNGNTIAFWILWSLLTVGMIVGFYALENKWLY